MNFHPRISHLAIALLISFCSCQPTPKKGKPNTAMYRTDSCLSNPAHRYEVYIPALPAKECKDLPLWILIDSHGMGKSALKHFRKAIEQHPAIVVASDYVRNNFEGFDQEIQRLVDDVREKYPVGNTLFLSGFSGGARMALAYGLNHSVDGLILCGALANWQQISHLQSPIVSISGMADFNFGETAQYLVALPSAPKNLKIIITDESHEWPGQSTLTEATGLLFYHTGNNAPANKREFKRYCLVQEEKIDSLTHMQEYIKAASLARNLAITTPFNKDRKFKEDFSTLLKHRGWKTQIARLKQTLNNEQKARQAYYQALLQKDTAWWQNELRANKKEELLRDNIIDRSLYKRIRAFWGIACYSICNDAKRHREVEKLEQVLPVYKTLEPENPDVYYFSALLPYWQDDPNEAIWQLKKALQLGYQDNAVLKSTFPDEIIKQLPIN